MVKQAISGVAVTLFVTLAALVYWKNDEHRPAPERSAPSSEMAELRGELAALKRGNAATLLLERVEAQQASQPSKAAEKPAVPEGSEAPAARPAIESDEELRARELEQAESLDRKFEAEPVDRNWAAEASQEARRALESDIGTDTTVGQVECRSTWCRIETFHPSVDAFKVFADKSLLSRERKIWNGAVGSNIRDESDGGVTAVTFLTREGYPMPLPEGVEATGAEHDTAAR